jgi:hypothetical protein
MYHSLRVVKYAMRGNTIVMIRQVFGECTGVQMFDKKKPVAETVWQFCTWLLVQSTIIGKFVR